MLSWTGRRRSGPGWRDARPRILATLRDMASGVVVRSSCAGLAGAPIHGFDRSDDVGVAGDVARGAS